MSVLGLEIESKIAQTRSRVRVLRAEHALADFEFAAVERLGFLVSPLGAEITNQSLI